MPNDSATTHIGIPTSPRPIGPLLEAKAHRALLDAALAVAARHNRIKSTGPIARRAAVDGVFTLAPWQSSFRDQGERGTCWAFAGAAALEAAYRRRFNLEVNVSEQYVFHMGKSFALNRTEAGPLFQPVENNSSLSGEQGCGDIVQKVTENAVAPEDSAPYIASQTTLEAILPVLGYASPASLVTQQDFDSFEFCEQHVPLLARVNARYRGTGWVSLGDNPSVAALENTLLAEHEVVCDVELVGTDKAHVLLLIGFDRNRQVFFAKNSWGENAFIEIAYANDPTFRIVSGWYIEDVVDPTFVQNEACWLGNWRVEAATESFRLLLRRPGEFAAPGAPTKLGTAYLSDGPHDVNGYFLDGGAHIRFFIAPTTAAVVPGTVVGTQIDARLDFADIYNAAGTAGPFGPIAMSRFTTRFAAVFEPQNGEPWRARHGIDAATYQATFNALVQQGFRLTSVCGYSEGREARFNAVWVKRGGPAWQARHGLTAEQYQATFNELVGQGFRLTCVSGYAEGGQARYAAIWELRDGPDWQARHGLSRAEYQATFSAMTAQGFVPVQVCGYRVNVDVRFAAIWERREGIAFVGRHGLAASEYQRAFDQQAAAGFRLVCVSGYSDSGIARYAAIWHSDQRGAWQARHGLDAAGYQQQFDSLAAGGFRPVQVSAYGDGFYPA
jgi:hypothetical protein